MERNSKGQFTKGANIKDLTGKRFGKLVVLRLGEKRSGRKTYWLCQCDCGNLKEVRSDGLKVIRSCGCLKKEQDKINLTANHSHKDSHTVLHNTWIRMKQRCENPENSRYERYGGRGITVSDEWQNYPTFRKWSLDNGFSPELTIERIDNDKSYEPDNCKWIPFSEQANNRKNTIWIEYKGRTQNLMQWCNELNLSYKTINQRFKRGKRAPELFEPIKTQYRGKY